MPTGYTSDVQTGKLTDFKTFALRCARAFGACIEQRDAPMDEPPKPREVSEYHDNETRKARRELERLSGMTTVDIEKEAAAENEESRAANERSRARSAAERERYETMLSAVTRWRPPTKEHEGLKRFMIEQLTDSIRFDCGDTYVAPELPPDEWHRKAIESAQRSLAYHESEAEKERVRVAESNAWIEALYRSLP